MALYMFPKTKKKKNSLHFRKKVELRATYPADGNHSHMRILLYAREHSLIQIHTYAAFTPQCVSGNSHNESATLFVTKIVDFQLS